MKIKREDLEKIIYEELSEVLDEKKLIKHLGKTVAPFALGAAVASGIGDKEPENPNKEVPELSPRVDIDKEKDFPEKPSIAMPERYNILNKLGSSLSTLHPLFDPSTSHGRAALAIALSIGGTETYGSLKGTKDFYTLMGGGRKVGNRMKGFAQFDTKYHRNKINTPKKYASFLANVITGKERMPNGKSSGDAVTGLERAILSGKVRGEKDLIRWLKANRFGGSNWQGIDDGWGRVPGLGDYLVQFVGGNLK